MCIINYLKFRYIDSHALLMLFAGLQSCQSYQGCPWCLHTWSPGPPLEQTKCVCDGYRRFLGPRSRARHQRTYMHGGHTYEYGSRELRTLPRMRDDNLIRDSIAVTKRIHGPFLGHKFVPQIAKLPGMDWYRLMLPELVHGMFSSTYMP